jgi:uncharacterized protein YqgC (DUF456 family)
LLLLLILTVLSEILEKASSFIGAKKYGTNHCGLIGVFLGGIPGLLLGGIVGPLMGPFLGAMLL